MSFKNIEKLLRKYPRNDGGMFSKSQVLYAYKMLSLQNKISLNKSEQKYFHENIKMKYIRSLSGVVPVAVLTKPFPCPGKCIFCPNDIKMPKSYLSSEPGAQRAYVHKFDPYLQTYNRLVALKNIGHKVQKIELIILGGTWSSYPKDYQMWFIKRCFDAMNDFTNDSDFIKIRKKKDESFEERIKQILPKNKTYNLAVSKNILFNVREHSTIESLNKAHKKNEFAFSRCVGLVIETRPDVINEEEAIWLRRLGVTKVQLGVQSTSSRILKLNKRGHTLKDSEKAVNILRKAGFKIHLHWMCNLYGSTPEKDKRDFKKIFLNTSLRPDELKVYPCSLVSGTELVGYYKRGLWKPYSSKELLNILSFSYINTPRYCRISRMIRDIPSTDILVGNKKTNFRQLVEKNIKNHNIVEIRSREIKGSSFNRKDIKFKSTFYKTGVSKEYFLEYILPDNTLLGFLRLSLPFNCSKSIVSELNNSAIIREVHIYGPSLGISSEERSVQHLGLGTKLIQKAQDISKKKGYYKISVISSVGTREYYRKLGFKDGNLYQFKILI